MKGNTLLLGQYCLCVPPWKRAAVVCGNSPTWVIAFCLLLASLVGLRQLTLHVFSQIKQRGPLLALLFAEAMCGREAPSRKSLRKPGHGCLLHPSCGVGRRVTWPVRFCLYAGSFILYSKSSQAYTERCRWRCFPKGHKYSWEIIGQPLGKPNRMETELAGVLIRGNPVSKTGLSLP